MPSEGIVTHHFSSGSTLVWETEENGMLCGGFFCFFFSLLLLTSFCLWCIHTEQNWIVPQADLVSISANPVWENKPMRCTDTAAWSYNHLQNVNRMQVDRRPVSDTPHVVTRAFAYSSDLLQLSDHNLLYSSICLFQNKMIKICYLMWCPGYNLKV